MDRLARMDADMKEMRSQNTVELEGALKMIAGLKMDIQKKDLALGVLKEEVKNQQAVAFQCAFRASSWTEENTVIKFERLTFQSGMSAEGLDINSGVFTVAQGHAGVWAVRSFIYGENIP